MLASPESVVVLERGPEDRIVAVCKTLSVHGGDSQSTALASTAVPDEVARTIAAVKSRRLLAASLGSETASDILSVIRDALIKPRVGSVALFRRGPRYRYVASSENPRPLSCPSHEYGSAVSLAAGNGEDMPTPHGINQHTQKPEDVWGAMLSACTR